MACCRNGTDVAVAEIDLDYLQTVRLQMPVMEHRRHDLYSTFSVKTIRGSFSNDYKFS